MKMNFDKIGGRKFVLAIISLIAGLATHVLSVKGLSTEVVGLIIGVIGTFSVANTVATIKTPGSQDVSELEFDALPPVDHTQLDLLRGQQALLEQIAVTVGGTQQMLLNAMQAGNQPK